MNQITLGECYTSTVSLCVFVQDGSKRRKKSKDVTEKQKVTISTLPIGSLSHSTYMTNSDVYHKQGVSY